ncbi:amidohydrolase [Celeribacter neptunius]|uniref:Amidohydrolase n=1 Tax=Celeribacter neptunius TaxID=588602 RepID=A0A1I3KQI6_9RHOB|nr:amidohydrolase [Celeribacter neptunius]SFI74726.1 amidohydrolase [Celeribacter neptunius]
MTLSPFPTAPVPNAWTLDPDTLAEAVALRHELHRFPEVSGAEHETAARIAARMRGLGAEVTEGLGGTGVAAVFGPKEEPKAGPEKGQGVRTLMIRAELDALPILEAMGPDYRSEHEGVGHLCGHDGHMAILFTVAKALARHAPACRVVLLFQPAEETGAGARAVLDDPKFAPLQPDLAISLHNLPKLPMGAVALQQGPVACASRGLQIRLRGATSHAARPENGRSPGLALANLIPALGALSRDLPTEDPGFRLCTVTHARLGVPSFGISPGEAELQVTLRTLLNAEMAALEAEARALIDRFAADFAPAITLHDAFSHSVNAPEATALLEAACARFPRVEGAIPMRPSEDFGLFGTEQNGKVIPAAMLFLGSGETQPELHNPDFDFPDALVPLGAEIFLNAIHQFSNGV